MVGRRANCLGPTWQQETPTKRMSLCRENRRLYGFRKFFSLESCSLEIRFLFSNFLQSAK